MKTFLRTIIVILVCCLMLSACSDKNEQETITEQSIKSCFEYVTDLSSGTEAYYKDLGYAIRLNYTRNIADVTILGLKLSDGTEYPSVTLNSLPFSFDKDGWLNITGKDIAPVIPGIAAKPLVNSFKIRLLHRTVDNVYLPVFMVKMTIDHRFSITSAPTEQLVMGATTSTDAQDKSFTTNQTSYHIDFNVDTRTITIMMAGASFSAQMLAMDIEMREVPFTVKGETVSFDKPLLIPYIGDTPYERFPISELKGSLNLGEGMDMSFVCTPGSMGGAKYEVDFKGTFLDSSK